MKHHIDYAAYGPTEGRKFTKSILSNLPHDKILDVGCGAGTYTRMFPQSSWTAIEIWEPYVDRHSLKSLYDEIIIEDVRLLDFSKLPRFDVAIAGDVLEHMTAEEALDVFNKLRSVANIVVISMPVIYFPYKPVFGNPYQEHIVDDWDDKKIRKAFGEPTWGHVDGQTGVYIYRTGD